MESVFKWDLGVHLPLPYNFQLGTRGGKSHFLKTIFEKKSLFYSLSLKFHIFKISYVTNIQIHRNPFLQNSYFSIIKF